MSSIININRIIKNPVSGCCKLAISFEKLRSNIDQAVKRSNYERHLNCWFYVKYFLSKRFPESLSQLFICNDERIITYFDELKSQVDFEMSLRNLTLLKSQGLRKIHIGPKQMKV